MEPTLRKCKQLINEQVARTKGDYQFATAKDPLIRCDCVRTDRNLSMLEQNLKGYYIRAYLDYSRRAKE